MTNNEIKAIVSTEGSKSKKMIALYNGGMEIKDIAELMGTRYNFVYNVVSNYTRINDVELRTNKGGDSKKNQIISLIAQGLSNTEISKITKSNYNYVYKIAKELTSK
jgi:transposase